MARSLRTEDKPIEWMGSSYDDLLDLPEEVADDIGYQLGELQADRPATDFGPVSSIGPGTMELRCDESNETYRAIYVAKFPEAIYVLHCFHKKSKSGISIPPKDRKLAEKRYKEMIELRRQHRE